MLTTKAAAKELSVSERRVRHLCLNGRLNATKHGRDYLIPPEKVVEYKNSPRRPGRPVVEIDAPPKRKPARRKRRVVKRKGKTLMKVLPPRSGLNGGLREHKQQ